MIWYILGGIALFIVVLGCVLALGARAGERNIMEREPKDLPLCSSCNGRHIPGLDCELAS